MPISGRSPEPEPLSSDFAVPTSPTMPPAPLPASTSGVDALHVVGSELRVPFGDPFTTPVIDQVTSALPPVGGVGAMTSPPGAPGAPAVPQLRDGGGGVAFDPYAVRRDFPILEERIHGGKRVVWLDNAATTQKPRAVIDRLTYYYEHENSNVHRAAHALAARATDAYESARETTRKFLNAPAAAEIVFVR